MRLLLVPLRTTSTAPVPRARFFRRVTESGQQVGRGNGIIGRMGEMKFKIVSGGQTGIDQAALAAAVAAEVPYGGWVPKGRRREGMRLRYEVEVRLWRLNYE